jgi:putative oxidoreductase
MSIPAALPRIYDRTIGGLERLAFVPPLLTRVVIGLAFVQTGLGKWADLDGVTRFFAELGLPAPAANAVLVASLEVVGGGALVAGLLTRPFAALLSTTMVVALITADRQAFLASWSRTSESSPTDVTSFVFLLFLLWLVVSGAGSASVDRLLGLVIGDGRPASAKPR